MTNPTRLVIGRTADLPHWQETFLASVVDRLPFPVERWDIVSPRALAEDADKRLDGAVLWLWAGQWRKALGQLRRFTAPVVVPVFDLGLTVAPPWPWRWLSDGKTHVGATTTLVPTTAFAARFLSELEGVPGAQVKAIALPEASKPRSQRQPDGKIRVGTFMTFLPSSNIPFFLAAAHYVAERRPDVRFSLAGYGPLEKHFRRMVHELDLDGVVRIEPTDSADVMDGFDVFFYAPERCDHLGPLSLAAARGLPCIVSEAAAAEAGTRDGHECLVAPTNEGGAAGELILRTLESEPLRRGLGQTLRTFTASKRATDEAATRWAELFQTFGLVPSVAKPRLTGAVA